MRVATTRDCYFYFYISDIYTWHICTYFLNNQLGNACAPQSVIYDCMARKQLSFDVAKQYATESARRAFYMGILVIVLSQVIVYLRTAPRKAWQFNSARKSNEVLNGGNFVQRENSSIQSRNLTFYTAFRYWEQLTMATNNLIALTALASYSGHQVVVPFVYVFGS